MVLAHLAVGVGDELVTVFKLDTIAGVGENFEHLARHFNQIFFAINPIEHGRITKRSAGRAGVGLVINSGCGAFDPIVDSFFTQPFSEGAILVSEPLFFQDFLREF